MKNTHLLITHINMIDNSKEYILCAAYKRVKPRKCKPYHPGVNEICELEIGYRHHDILQRFHSKHEWVAKLLHKLKLYKLDNKIITKEQFVDFHKNIYWVIPDYKIKEFKNRLHLMWGIRRLR